MTKIFNFIKFLLFYYLCILLKYIKYILNIYLIIYIFNLNKSILGKKKYLKKLKVENFSQVNNFFFSQFTVGKNCALNVFCFPIKSLVYSLFVRFDYRTVISIGESWNRPREIT